MGQRESERNVIWTNTIFICVHTLGRDQAASAREDARGQRDHPPQGSACPPTLGESGSREAQGIGGGGRQKGLRASCLTGGTG